MARVDFPVSEKDYHDRRSVCATCRAPIIWSKSQKTGKAMPLDVASAQVEERTSGAEGAPLPALVYRLESHFAHCPDRDRHRADRS